MYSVTTLCVIYESPQCSQWQTTMAEVLVSRGSLLR